MDFEVSETASQSQFQQIGCILPLLIQIELKTFVKLVFVWFDFVSYDGWFLCSYVGIADAYLRKTGLERSEAILKDLEWLKAEGVEIPNPSSPGTTYVKHLEELAERSAPLFLSHFYNIHFSHITAGQVIIKQVLTFPLS